jgi:holliday junction DNA helicase RuvA
VISALRGTVLAVSGGSVVLDVHGVGFQVAVTPRHALALRHGEEATLLTSLIVREDSLSLFGFPDQDSLDIFTALVGVTGVGPKSALGVLAEMTPDAVAIAVTSEDDTAFKRVSGIGPKTAKLIVVSLAGKLALRPAPAPTPAAAAPGSLVRADVEKALVGLGWPERSAAAAVDEVLETASEAESSSVQALLRLALGVLGGGRPVGDRA